MLNINISLINGLITEFVIKQINFNNYSLNKPLRWQQTSPLRETSWPGQMISAWQHAAPPDSNQPPDRLQPFYTHTNSYINHNISRNSLEWGHFLILKGEYKKYWKDYRQTYLKKQMNVPVRMCGSLVAVIRNWDFEDQVAESEGGRWK